MNIDVLQNIKPEHIFNDPYPHIYIENALPDDVYAELEKEFPVELIKNNTDIKSIYIINNDIENYFIKNRLIQIMSYRCLIIIILTKLFHSQIFIDTTLMNDFTDTEKAFILYLQYINRVSLINV